MSDRIAKRFAVLAKEKRAGLIPFIMGGDPSPDISAALLAALPGAGADLIEIGVPFSDPMADGPIIQAAGLRALKGGATLLSILAMVRRFREADAQTPLILMGYYNPFYHYGVERFCRDATEAGVDGVILVDLPPEEEEEFTSQARPFHLSLIRLVAPTTDAERLETLTRNAGGFLYYIAVAGITGTRSASKDELNARVATLKAASPLPVAVGFGIKTPEQAADVAAFADAVVVGSALVELLQKESPESVLKRVAAVRTAMDASRK